MAIYFVSPTGSDGANGTSQVTAWQTITKVNATTFSPGDSVLFQGGQSFRGNIVITGVTGSSSLPITVDSYGAGVATIAAGNGAAVYFHNCSGIVCQNLTVTGGVVGTNTGSGIQIINDLAGNVVLNYIRLNNITASGFGGNLAQAGILIQGNNSLSGFNDIRVTNVNCNGNMNGMLIGAVAGQTGTGIVATNVYVGASVFHDNQGLAGTPNNCGNGCLLYECNNGLVERCLAYNNGAANNNVAGPSGIWTSKSNNGTIQNCKSHHNTSNVGDAHGSAMIA